MCEVNYDKIFIKLVTEAQSHSSCEDNLRDFIYLDGYYDALIDFLTLIRTQQEVNKNVDPAVAHD